MKVTRKVQVEGLRDAHLGPKMEYAKISLMVEPANQLEVVLPQQLEGDEPMFVEAAVFGFLDVVLVADLRPWRDLRISVIDFKIDPINSSASAFQHAGRDAARKFLDQVVANPAAHI